MIRFNWENLDTMPLLLLLRYSSNLSNPGWNPRLEAFFSSPSPGWPSRPWISLDCGIHRRSGWSTPGALHYSLESSLGLRVFPKNLGRHWHFNRPLRSLGHFRAPRVNLGKWGGQAGATRVLAQLRFLVLPLCHHWTYSCSGAQKREKGASQVLGVKALLVAQI